MPSGPAGPSDDPKRGPDSPVERFRDRLGLLPDAEIAKLAGVTRSGVQKYRQRHGIPAPTEGGVKRRGRPTAIAEELLGQLSDAEIARRAGRSRSAVQKLRTRRGIAPHSDDAPAEPVVIRDQRTWGWRLRIATAAGVVVRVTVAPDAGTACAAGLRLGDVIGAERVAAAIA